MHGERVSWPMVMTGVIALIPVAAFGFILAMLVVASWPALQSVGSGLFDPLFAGPGSALPQAHYGLLAPLWGTVQLTCLTLLVALPTALAVAILVAEMPIPVLSRVLSPLLGLMSGIPPIVYGMVATVLMEAWMRPKFGGWALDEPVRAAIMNSPVYIPSRLPINLPSSQVLGALLMALLVVPVIAPLLVDVLGGVPREIRLASYALGAGRWHTLTRVVLPAASSGIVGAVTLGALKAIGEVTIPYLILSSGPLSIVQLPSPLVDVFAPTSPLSSSGAALLRTFSNDARGAGPSVGGLPQSVAYLAGLTLLVMAVGIMGIGALAEKRVGSRRRS